MRVVVERAPVKGVIDMGKTVVDKMTDEHIGNPVIRKPALVPRRDEEHPPQEGQLVARDRQREIEGVRDVPDGQLVMRECVHERKPNRACEEPEDLRCPPEHLRRGEAAPGPPDFLPADDFGESSLRFCYHS